MTNKLIPLNLITIGLPIYQKSSISVLGNGTTSDGGCSLIYPYSTPITYIACPPKPNHTVTQLGRTVRPPIKSYRTPLTRCSHGTTAISIRITHSIIPYRSKSHPIGY